MKRILVIAAHPDDEILGCGGTMAAEIDRGNKVQICILGEGLTSRHTDRNSTTCGDLADLQQCSENAARAIGVKDVRHLGLPDNRFDTVDLLDVIKKIESVVRDFQPEEVYTQHGGDLNVDHEVTFRATLTALRPLPEAQCCRRLLAYEVGSSTEYAFGKFAPRFSPNVFRDIGPYLEQKVTAMEAYLTEARPFPHPRSPQALRASAARWGINVGVAAAEPFELIWQIE